MFAVRLCILLALLGISVPGSAMELVSVSGDKTNLNALHKSKMWTLVFVWSLDCVACEKQKPMLEAFHNEHRLANAHVIGIVSDGDEHTEAIKQRIRGNAFSFNSYIPKSNRFNEEFSKLSYADFKGTPTYLLYKPGGTLAGVHAGIIQRSKLEEIVGPAERLQTPSMDLIR